MENICPNCGMDLQVALSFAKGFLRSKSYPEINSYWKNFKDCIEAGNCPCGKIGIVSENYKCGCCDFETDNINEMIKHIREPKNQNQCARPQDNVFEFLKVYQNLSEKDKERFHKTLNHIKQNQSQGMEAVKPEVEHSPNPARDEIGFAGSNPAPGTRKGSLSKKDEEYLDKEFPKGETKFRGQAMVLIALARQEGKIEAYAEEVAFLKALNTTPYIIDEGNDYIDLNSNKLESVHDEVQERIKKLVKK